VSLLQGYPLGGVPW